jgi:septum formation protein
LAEPQSLILASRSPQRRAILEQLGIPFSVVFSGVEELEHGPPDEVARQNATRKAGAVAVLHPDALVLGVDTLVYLDGTIHGNPAGTDEARAILRALSGRRHTVVGGVCLVRDGEMTTAVARTTVSFRRLDARMIEWYLASEEWHDRAGGYAIQGRGAALVVSIAGDYLNVVGLPVSKLLALAPELLGR